MTLSTIIPWFSGAVTPQPERPFDVLFVLERRTELDCTRYDIATWSPAAEVFRTHFGEVTLDQVVRWGMITRPE